MIDLSKRELECIDLELQRYRTIKNRIYLRRQELIHSNSNNFTNATFGKEKKVVKPTEKTIISLDTDITLKNLESFKLTVETLMNELIETDLIIFKLRFLNVGIDWDRVAYELNKTKTYINKRRMVISKKYIELKGFYPPSF